jgi:hypothetical protein
MLKSLERVFVDNGMKLIVKKFELSAFFVLGSSHTLPGTVN